MPRTILQGKLQPTSELGLWTCQKRQRRKVNSTKRKGAMTLVALAKKTPLICWYTALRVNDNQATPSTSRQKIATEKRLEYHQSSFVWTRIIIWLVNGCKQRLRTPRNPRRSATGIFTTTRKKQKPMPAQRSRRTMVRHLKRSRTNSYNGNNEVKITRRQLHHVRRTLTKKRNAKVRDWESYPSTHRSESTQQAWG